MARAGGHCDTAAAFEAQGIYAARFCVDGAEYLARDFTPFRLSGHSTGVATCRNAAVAEISDNGQKRVGVSDGAVFGLCLVDIGGADNMAVGNWFVYVSYIIVWHGDTSFCSIRILKAQGALDGIEFGKGLCVAGAQVIG